MNSEPLPSGSRFTPSIDFGLAKLTVKGASLGDAGVYTCSATNALGTATTSGTVKVIGEAGSVLSGTQHPSGQSGLASINEVEKKAVSGTLPHAEDDVEMKGEAPRFVVPLSAETRVEGAKLRLECEVEPKNDADLKVTWELNGAPLEMGSRVRAECEFGRATLEVDGASARDRGVYACKAANAAGEAATFTTVDCEDDEPGLDLASKHPKGAEGLDALSRMEARGRLPDAEEAEEEAGEPPRFVTEFRDITAAENGTAFAEAMLEPKKDPNMRVEWRLNGEAVQESNRLRTISSFGMVVFELKSLREGDFGEYTCTATNRHGAAQSGFRMTEAKETDARAPRFTSQLRDVVDLVDGQSVHLGGHSVLLLLQKSSMIYLISSFMNHESMIVALKKASHLASNYQPAPSKKVMGHAYAQCHGSKSNSIKSTSNTGMLVCAHQ